MRHQTAIRQYNPKKQNRYRLPWKSLVDVRFSYIYKSVLYAAKQQAGDGPHYIKAIIGYVKYLVQYMEKEQLIKRRTIPTECLYKSTESINRLNHQNQKSANQHNNCRNIAKKKTV